jgi:hypothetical protein
MVKEKKPHFVFLMETLCTKAPLESLRSRLDFEGLFNYYGSYWKEWWFSSSVEGLLGARDLQLF